MAVMEQGEAAKVDEIKIICYLFGNILFFLGVDDDYT